MSTTARETRPTSDLTNAVRQKHKEYLFPATIQYYQEPIVVTDAKGLRVRDADGNEYLDFFGGILTVSVVHGNEKVNSAIKAQVDRLSHISTLYPTLPVVELAERLAQIAPGKLRQMYFTASGTEADETAVMMAELFTGRSEIIALRHGYSGRSTLAQSLTAQSTWRPLPTKIAGIKHAPTPYCYRCPMHLTYPSCGIACANDIEDIIRTTTTGRVAAFLAEPIQGVGGFITPPPEYFEAAAVDGAGFWERFRYVIVPLTRPATVTVVILSLIYGLRSFDLIWAMTRGGPGFTSDVIASVIYKQYQAGFFGLSTAGNVVLFLLVTVIVVPLSFYLNRRETQL